VTILAHRRSRVVECSSWTGAQFAAVEGHQRRRNAVHTLAAVGASMTINMAGGTHDVCILVKTSFARARIVGEYPVTGRITAGAVTGCHRAGQAARVADGTQLD